MKKTKKHARPANRTTNSEQRRKSLAAALLAAALAWGLAACGGPPAQPPREGASSAFQTQPQAAPAPSPEESGAETHILVACFSATGTTRPLAEYAAQALGADLYEISPQEPYTAQDLNYSDSESRASREQNDPDARPALSGRVEDMGRYDTVVIAHPIWWGQAPRVISTFLESYDFSGKTLATFVTSGGSPVGASQEELHGLCGENVRWVEGTRFEADATPQQVEAWLRETGLAPAGGPQSGGDLAIEVNGHTLTASLADNSSARALRELLDGGPLTLKMEDYNQFEKVGPLGAELPRNDEEITTGPGDLILYQGNQLVIYYGTNAWNFTRLGRIQEADGEELLRILGEGDVTVTLSLVEETEGEGNV